MNNKKKLYILLSIIGLVILSLSVKYFYIRNDTNNEKTKAIISDTNNEKIKDIYSPTEQPSNVQNPDLIDESNF
ncbi:MAG: hypothetical protein WC850_06520 [Candidatus Gracilibacteria bacterium]|jgi:hypothetical protein